MDNVAIVIKKVRTGSVRKKKMKKEGTSACRQSKGAGA